MGYLWGVHCRMRMPYIDKRILRFIQNGVYIVYNFANLDSIFSDALNVSGMIIIWHQLLYCLFISLLNDGMSPTGKQSGMGFKESWTNWRHNSFIWKSMPHIKELCHPLVEHRYSTSLNAEQGKFDLYHVQISHEILNGIWSDKYLLQ